MALYFSVLALPIKDVLLLDFPINQKEHIFTEYHSVCPLVGIGTLPPPLSPASVPLHPEPKGGSILACGWGVGGVSIPTTGEKLSTLPTLQLEERDSDARDVSGVKTPLFLAIRAKHLPAIRLLIGTQLYLFSQSITRLNIFSHILYLQTVFRIRIWIPVPDTIRSVDPYPDSGGQKWLTKKKN